MGPRGRLRPDVRDRRRLLPRPEVPARSDRGRRRRRRPGPRLPVQDRCQRHQLADLPPLALLLRQPLRPLDYRAAAHRRDQRVQVLPARGPRRDSARAGPLQRLRLPDRDALPGLEERVPGGRGAHHLRGPGGRQQQDEQGRRARGRVDGLVAPCVDSPRSDITGIRFYKMTGSGNDFVFVDGSEHPVESWPVAAIRAACDRRTGVGGDGLVVLVPAGPEAVRMVYFNADGSRAGMCGNAALCSTRLAARLGLAPATGMVLHTDTGLLKTRCVGPGWAAELLLPDLEPATALRPRAEARPARAARNRAAGAR